jgi:hypothetical protein
LQQYRLGNSVRPLIEFTQIYPVSHLQVTEYGRAYHAGFAQLYRERYAEGIARG